MPRDLNEPADRPDDGSPAGSIRSRRRVSARIAAIAGLSMAAVMAVVALSVTGPPSARADSFSDCVNEAIVWINTQAAALPASERNAYIRTEVDAARVRCGAILAGTTTTTTATTTTTTTTSTTAPGRYEITVTGVIGTGPQTLAANCRTGDRLVSYRYQVGNPTGSTTSRSVNVSSNGQGVTLTYEVVGTVADPRTSLTIVCRSA